MFRYDETDPQMLIAYTGADHANPDAYREMIAKWISWMEKGQRFGVIFVSEPHEHTDDEDHREDEAEFTRLLNDFRRDYRDRTSQINVGFARVLPQEWVALYFPNPGDWERGWEGNDRYAQYNWGIPGGAFTDVNEAKNWIRQQFNRKPSEVLAEAVPQAEVPANKRVGLFYGSSTGITEYIAEEIETAWKDAGMEPIEAVNIGSIKNLSEFLNYDCLILGIPTWNIGELQDDWDIVFSQLDTLDFKGKKAAIFGIGDQRGYPDNFLDAVGILGNKLIERGAELVGYWYDEHYQFTESKGFVEGKFMGLGIDDVNQSKLSSDRIEQWVAQIIGEFALQPAAISQ